MKSPVWMPAVGAALMIVSLCRADVRVSSRSQEVEHIFVRPKTQVLYAHVKEDCQKKDRREECEENFLSEVGRLKREVEHKTLEVHPHVELDHDKKHEKEEIWERAPSRLEDFLKSTYTANGITLSKTTNFKVVGRARTCRALLMANPVRVRLYSPNAKNF